MNNQWAKFWFNKLPGPTIVLRGRQFYWNHVIEDTPLDGTTVRLEPLDVAEEANTAENSQGTYE